MPAQGSIDLAQIGRAIDHQGAVVLRVDIRAAQGILVAEFTDDLFENVFKRHDSQYVAVFVDDNADASFLLLEIDQLGRKGRVFRDEIGIVAGLEQAFVGQLIMAEQPRDLAHVDDAFDLVDVLAEHRQACVGRRAQLSHDGFQVVL